MMFECLSLFISRRFIAMGEFMHVMHKQAISARL
jgi:hypothetical protein